MATEEERPAKRLKVSNEFFEPPSHEHSVSSTGSEVPKPIKANETPSQSRKPQHKTRQKNGTKASSRSEGLKTFSQPSAMCVGDRGIFVTCDIGREKKSLLELQDLVQQYLDQQNIDIMGDSLVLETGTLGATDLTPRNEPQNHEIDEIEADIAAELQSLRDSGSSEQGISQTAKPMQLITLDIPCVSFLRFPAKSVIDPVRLVHTLCDQAAAAADQSSQKSRYIRRLTPISKLGKVLSQGLDKVCDEILPLSFGRIAGVEVQSTTFAIRPTVRNNDKIDRDQIIQAVAEKIHTCGEGKHKVNLKHSEKCVLVEVYRGWVGISVVDNATTGVRRKGYEQLKRFNLAEIYASR